MNKNNLPKITIAIPTFNEEENIKWCLDSIFRQNYPQHLLEVIVVDDYSQDNTVKIAKQYPVKILYNGSHDGEVGKMIAFKKAKGELFYYLDADCELKGKNWFQKMLKPLLEDKTIVGSFTRYATGPKSSSLERYYNLHPTQCDPIYEFFSPSITETIIAQKKDYQICCFSLDKIPPVGRILYRREILYPLIKGMRRFLELDIEVILTEQGYDHFAYVPQAGIYHYHVRNFADLIRKRLRNVQKVYLPEIEKRRYLWFDLRKPRDAIKTIFWIIYAHLFLPALIRGILKSIKYKDWVGLYEPVVTLLATDTIIFGFLTSKKGRVFIKKRI